MPRKPASAPPAPEPPTVSPEEGIKLLQEQTESAKTLCAPGAVKSDDYYAWRAETEAALIEAIGRNQQLALDAVSAGSTLGASMMSSDADVQSYQCKAIQSEVKILEACIRTLEKKAFRQAPLSAPRQAPDPLAYLRRVLARFHAVALSLRQRHDKRVPFRMNDEYDVQDLLHALLAIDFEDIRPEEYTPSYAGKSTRMDFLLKSEEIVVEAKFARTGHAEKEIGTELIADIARYGAHQDCKHLVCFVYDPTHAIRNAAALERDLSGPRNGLSVEVFVAPKP